jgi:pimeloyl-ACP methyl ester carboxylesterase
MPFAQVNEGLSMYYDEGGSGEPVLWLAGTGTSGGMWSRFQVPAFTDRYRCIAMDLRGTGRTDAPDMPYSMPMLAKDVEGLMRHLELERAHLVGFSMGSAIIQELALTAPQLVRSAVLCGTWSSTSIEHHIRRHYESRMIQLREAPPQVFQSAGFWGWSPSFVDDEADLMEELEAFVGEVSSGEPGARLEHYRADLAHDTLARLGGVSTPTLVLYGAEDLITLPRYNQRVAAAIPGAELQEIQGGGHMVLLERPDDCNAAIRDFLDRTSDRADGPRPAAGRNSDPRTA